jgi:hypothetical protein
MNHQNSLFIGLTLVVLIATQVVDRARAAGASELAGTECRKERTRNQPVLLLAQAIGDRRVLNHYEQK